MSAAAIDYFNRYTRRIETEQVYGESWLRFTYGNPLGQLALHALVKRACFSRWYGRRMDDPASRARIAPFIARYGLDPAEFAETPDRFGSFNEFFYRRLKPAARPVDPDPASVVFPADGRHLGFADSSRIPGVFVKGQVFSLTELIADRELAGAFAGGALVLSRLCPVDYHRFHFPAAGVPAAAREIPGPLYSVNPVALRQNIHIFSTNRRALGLTDAGPAGRVLIIEVGATCVGGIVHTFTPGQAVTKGAERGYFRFGGSSLITLFEPGRITLAEDLLAQTAAGRELYARVGDRLGRLTA